MAEHWPEDDEIHCTEHSKKKYSACMEEEVRALTERLERFDAPRPKCNKGHENVLPLKLWDCPVCTEEIRAERDRLRADLEAERHRADSREEQMERNAHRRAQLERIREAAESLLNQLGSEELERVSAKRAAMATLRAALARG